MCQNQEMIHSVIKRFTSGSYLTQFWCTHLHPSPTRPILRLRTEGGVWRIQYQRPLSRSPEGKFIQVLLIGDTEGLKQRWNEKYQTLSPVGVTENLNFHTGQTIHSPEFVILKRGGRDILSGTFKFTWTLVLFEESRGPSRRVFLVRQISEFSTSLKGFWDREVLPTKTLKMFHGTHPDAVSL